MRHALLDEPVRPPADRAARHDESRLLRLADPDPARRRVRDGKEGQDGAGRPASSP